MNEELNEDGLPVGVPLTFEQIRQAEFNRANRQMADAGSDAFRIFTQQAQRKQRRKREEAEGGEA